MVENNNWLVLKLTYTGENTPKRILDRNLIKIFGKRSNIFFPYQQVDQDRYNSKTSVLDGYIFIQNADLTKLSSLEGSPYFTLLNNKAEFVDNNFVVNMRQKLKNICEESFEEGEYVKITDGPYSNMEAMICQILCRDKVVLEIKTRSICKLVEIPKVAIKRI